MIKWQGRSSYLLGFEIPIFGIHKVLSFCLEFKTYHSITVPNFHDLIKREENMCNLISKCSNFFDFVMYTYM